ncbi:low molecular weight phosphatase family protein [Frigoribacterium faeni]|nr:low molecular weight phosphatase family protein [Frigoribacterium faeni]
MSVDFKILVVCTGNICRSPLAAQYFSDELAGLGVVTVQSAGTMALVGQDMPGQARELAVRRGRTPKPHVAQLLTPELVADADLVVAMSRDHRKAVVSSFPRAAAYTFTLREFERLARTMSRSDLHAAREKPDVAPRLRGAVAAVASRRGLVPQPTDSAEDDVVDPYRQADTVFDQTGAQLYPAADVIVHVLRSAAMPDARS